MFLSIELKCFNCHKLHKRCGTERPCRRCKRGKLQCTLQRPKKSKLPTGSNKRAPAQEPSCFTAQNVYDWEVPALPDMSAATPGNPSPEIDWIPDRSMGGNLPGTQDAFSYAMQEESIQMQGHLGADRVEQDPNVQVCTSASSILWVTIHDHCSYVSQTTTAYAYWRQG